MILNAVSCSGYYQRKSLDFLLKSKTSVEALWSLRSIDLRVIAIHPSFVNMRMPRNTSLAPLKSDPMRVNVFFLCDLQNGEFAVSRTRSQKKEGVNFLFNRAVTVKAEGAYHPCRHYSKENRIFIGFCFLFVKK